jgi:hypothetical protein
MTRGAFSRRAAIGGFLALGAGAGHAQEIRMGWGGGTRIPVPPPTPPYTPPTRLASILDIYKRMTGPVMVQGTGPYPFVADTGANQSVISSELAIKLGLDVRDYQPLNGVAGVQMTPTVTATLQIGQQAPREAALFVLSGEAIGGPGMLGLDQLGDARLTLDFERQAITINEGPALPGAGEEVEARAYRRDGQLTLVDANLAGIRVTAFLDSGAQDTMGNMALRQLALTRYPTTTFSHLPIISVTGQSMQAEFADLPGLTFGGLTLPNWPVAFADLHLFRMWGLIDKPALVIGVDVLSRFSTVCLDFRRDQVRFRLPARA